MDSKIDGNVKNICKEFLVKEDESLAYRLQNQEFHTHFDMNRKQRKSIRSDIPVAKSVQHTEYAEQLRRHQMLEELERQDQLIAQQEQQRMIEEINHQIKLQQLADEVCRVYHYSTVPLNNHETNTKIKEYAKSLQTKPKPLSSPDENDDANQHLKEYLKKLQEQDLQISKYLKEQEKRKISSQMPINSASSNSIDEDERLARQLQEEENLKYQRYHSSIKYSQNDVDQQRKYVENSNTKSNNNKAVQGPFIVDQTYLNSAKQVHRPSNSHSSLTRNDPSTHKKN